MVLVEMLIEDPLPILSHVCRLPKARKKQGRLRIGEVEEQGSCDFKVSGECSVEEVTAEQKHEREEEAGSTDIWRKIVAGRKKQHVPRPWNGACLMHPRNSE